MATKDEQRELRTHLKARDRGIELLVARLERLLDENLSGLLVRLKSKRRGTLVPAQEAAAMLGSFYTELQSAGLDRELGSINALYGDEIDYVGTLLERSLDKEITFSGATQRTIDALIEVDKRKFTGAIQRYSGDISAAVMRQVVLGDIPTRAALREEYGDKLGAQLKTEITTSVSAFSRTITADQARELDLDLFIYRGPDDGLTREFCGDVLNGEPAGVEPRDVPIYTSDEIAQMDNGQGLDVQIYCGGYNCRHQWSPITLDRAIALGYDPPKR